MLAVMQTQKERERNTQIVLTSLKIITSIQQSEEFVLGSVADSDLF